MTNDSYFRLNDVNKMKYKYSHNQQKGDGLADMTHSPIYCIKDGWDNGLRQNILDKYLICSKLSFKSV